MEIGKNIKYLRQLKNMTQDQLAEYLGVTYQAVSKWETSANSPDICLLPQIAKCFNVSLDTLFAENISEENISVIRDVFERFEDDGVIRVVQIRGREVLRVDETGLPQNAPAIEIAFPRNYNAQTQYFKVEVFGDVCCDSSINGDVICHQKLHCHVINGDVVCHQALDCMQINGEIRKEAGA